MNRLLLLMIVLLLIGCAENEPPPLLEVETGNNQPTATPAPALIEQIPTHPWWNDRIFYEVFVRSFYDSNGDGVGDINGLIEKLDYINDGDPTTTSDLGATGIWLMPIAVSPSYHGYDVVDYFQVDPEYGTNDDFKRLMEEAHARGIAVIVDLVLNHTSVEHPWFLESQDPASEYRDWYIWEDEPPAFRGPWGQIVWHPRAGSHYYGVFWVGMPDLNYRNPAVTDAMYEIADFWLEEMQVDGFRLDAIKHMVEEGRAQENTRSTHDWMEDFYTYYKSVDSDALTVGEAWTGTSQVVEYTGDEVDIAFQFDLALDILNTADSGLAPIYAKTQTLVYESFPPNQYATFITNHDQNRVMSYLNGEVDKAKVAASILLTSPGVPFIYYGEEIGMTGKKPDEDIRLPMQWASNSPKVGFTTGTPWRPAASDFPVVSVERQDSDPDSILNHYRQLIALRNQHEALRVGDWMLVETGSPRVYAFLRYTDDEVILVVINTHRHGVSAEKYALSLPTSPLTSTPRAITLFGASAETIPTLNADNGFSNYRPFSEIPSRTTHIIHLRTDN